MTDKRLLLGDEAIALGAIHAGISAVYAYPGTPSTEITEFIQNDDLARQRQIHSSWCTNEKTAMEAALGMSYSGKRALVCMKHVGMNVCADAFVNAAVTGVNGGVLVVAADDPSMHSSQNEQDSRFYGNFAMVPIFEPSSQQEAYDMISLAFGISEQFKTPVLLRIVTRLAHSRAVVRIGDSIQEQKPLNPSTEKNWILLPANARKQYSKLIEKQKYLASCSFNSGFNRLEIIQGSGIGVIACGIAYNYISEASPDNISAVLKISHYPLPEELVRNLAGISSEIIVLEDGQSVVEQEVKALLSADVKVHGRLDGYLPRSGELTPDNVAEAFGIKPELNFAQAENLVARPPQFCLGCGHRDVYNALNMVASEYENAQIFGDIGCYTLGALPPFNSISSCVDMGASITMAKGAADAGQFPSIAVIGDSTFTHSGMTGLLDAVNDKSNITIILSDNLTTAMTGGQDSAGTNKFEAICIGIGVEKEHVRVVNPVPNNMDEITRIIREEIQYNGVSVIIPRRECMQTLARKLRAKKQ